MKKMYNILQHYNKYDQPFVRKVWNAAEDCVYNYSIKNLGFCNPNELKIINDIVNLFEIRCAFEGGFEKSELKKVIIYPNDYEIENNVFIYELEYNRKFTKLEHRHIMGTLYNLGINERLLGDIIVNDEGRCQLVIDDEFGENIEILVTKYNNIPVKYSKIENISIENKSLNKKVYSSKSLRLDAVCKAISLISRNQISKEIKKGMVSVNYKVIDDIKYEISENDLISIRGHGRIIISRIVQVNNKYNIHFNTTSK